MKLIALLTLTLLVSCGKDESMKIIHNNDRVTMLEARMQLAESNIQLTNSRIDALDSRLSIVESDLTSLQASSAASDAQLQANIDSLSAETAQSISDILAQIDGLNQADEDFQDQLNSLSNQLDSAIASLNDDVSDLSDSLSSTQSQLNQVKNRVAALELSQFVQNVILAGLSAAIGDIYSDLEDVQDNQAALAAQVSNLAGQVSALANQVNNLPESLTEAQIQAMIDDAITPLQEDITALQGQISPPQPVGSCVITEFASYSGQRQYSFSVSGLSNYNNYGLEVKFTNPVWSVGDSNGGSDSLSSNGKTWMIEPQNGASSFNFYTYFSGSNREVESAKVTKGATTINCSVQN